MKISKWNSSNVNADIEYKQHLRRKIEDFQRKYCDIKELEFIAEYLKIKG